MEKERFENAVRLLNKAEWINKGKKLRLIKSELILGEDEDANKEAFMVACESIEEKNEKFIPEEIANVYNELADKSVKVAEELADKSVKVAEELAEKVVSPKGEKMMEKEKVVSPKGEKMMKKEESRPAMLRRKIEKGIAKLEDLVKDAELLAKYNNHINWITKDFEKIIAKR